MLLYKSLLVAYLSVVCRQGHSVQVSTLYRSLAVISLFSLVQGHSRRVLVHVKPVQNSGTLPLIVEGIQHVSIGCVTARSRLQKGLDSYQEEDLSVLRGRWSDALEKRREYLDQQLQQIMAKDGEWAGTQMCRMCY